tara:strand:+ start:4707 stop:5441 length:735 start_codon:yes stop_codon:yes gene_type:complete
MTLMTPSYAPPLSLHIPRIDVRNIGPHFRDEDFVRLFIANQFEQQNIGTVSKVDLLAKQNHAGYPYYEAFVHFERWTLLPHSLALRRAACSPFRKATIPLLGTQHYWIVNESLSPVYEEDWQSILSVIPGSTWQQAAEEQELVEHQKLRADATILQRWYKHIPTEEETQAISIIEAFAVKHCKPSPITCPAVLGLLAYQAQMELDQSLLDVAQAETELAKAQDAVWRSDFLASPPGTWSDYCTA